MTKNQENKLTMYEAIHSILQDNASVTATVPAFQPALQEFGAKLGELKNMALEVKTAFVGKNADKKTTEAVLIGSLIKVTSAMQAIAHRTRNQTLAEKAKITESQLRHSRDTDLMIQATGIHAAALEVADQLKDFGITAANLDELSSQIAAFHQALGKREGGMAQRGAARNALADLFTGIDTILRQDLDKLMELLKTDHPQFYDAYQKSRVIKHLGIRTRPGTEPPPANP
jgi:hypothetical protein